MSTSNPFLNVFAPIAPSTEDPFQDEQKRTSIANQIVRHVERRKRRRRNGRLVTHHRTDHKRSDGGPIVTDVTEGTITPRSLAASITDISPGNQLSTIPSLQITLLDPSWKLLGSGIFDVDDNGKLDPVGLTFPEGSRRQWVLNQVSLAGSAHTITLTFVPLLVVRMMRTHKRMKANRAKTTRAEFLKTLVEGCGGTFYCRQLEVTQPAKKPDLQSAQPASARAAPMLMAAASAPTFANPFTGITDPFAKASAQSTKPASQQPVGAQHRTGGLSDAQTEHRGAPLTVKGAPINSQQKQVVNTILSGCRDHNAPEQVCVAAVYAGIGESGLSSSNLFQRTQLPGSSPADQIEAWLTGGTDFPSGGALAIAKDHPTWPAWKIANDTERNAVWNANGLRDPENATQAAADSYYNEAGGHAFLGEAEAIVRAGGIPAGGTAADTGSHSETHEVIQPYYFTVGTSQNPHESWWAAFVRLCQEVNWPYVIDGDVVWYDSGLTLIKAKVAAEVHRGHASVVDWSYDWESRNIATNLQLTLICGPFEFLPGDVFSLVGFGAASDGSTAGLPGRWLLSQVQRSESDLSSQITLQQPPRPKKEPAPAVKEVTTTVSSTTEAAGGPTSIAQLRQHQPRSLDALVASAQFLSTFIKTNGVRYAWGGDRDVTSPPSKTVGMDCSGSTGWVFYNAGFALPGGAKSAPVSGDWESWGEPGPGRYVTVWCSSEHVFTEFKIPQAMVAAQGGSHMQGNTSYGSANGLSTGDGYQFFPWGQNGASDAASGGYTARHPKGL